MTRSILVTPPERQAILLLADGRKLARSEWGPVDGIPVLFCTGAGMSSWLGFGASDLASLGLKLIGIDRPGLGDSDPHPTKTLASWVEDIRQFIQNQLFSHVLAVGFSQGTPFALALAEQNLVQAIAIVSGQDDLTHPSLKSLLPTDVASLIASVQQDPIAFERHITQTATADWLWQIIIDMSAECDRELYTNDSFRTAYQQALQEGFSQGAAGYARDLVNALSPWPIKLENITIGIDLWYGCLDASPVHSPDFGATLAARLPNATRTVDRQAGSSILWAQSQAILSKLRSRI